MLYSRCTWGREDVLETRRKRRRQLGARGGGAQKGAGGGAHMVMDLFRSAKDAAMLGSMTELKSYGPVGGY
jgi:hypothetical protein